MTATLAQIDTATESRRRFDRSDDWVIRDAVPVFAEHEKTVKAKDGTDDVVRFDRDALQEIAANCNRRESETGDACPLILGHIPNDAAEMDLGDIVGYARNFRVGRFGPAQKLGILATFYFLKDKYDAAMQHPRRSVELWTRDQIIDPIALLKRTPQLDLGLLTYQRNYASKHKRYLYAMGDDPMEPDAMQQFMKAIQDGFAQLGQKLDACMGGAQQNAMASGSNTAVPEGGQPQTYAKATPPTVTAKPAEDDKLRMAREQSAIELAQYQKRAEEQDARIKALESREAESAKKFQKSQRERDLIQLEAEGFKFDRAAELDDFADRDDAAWQKHQARIKERYQRAPVGDGIPRFAMARDQVEGTDGKLELGRDRAERAVNYMMEHEKDPEFAKLTGDMKWAKAEAAIRAGA
jgi:hypothetical protein